MSDVLARLSEADLGIVKAAAGAARMNPDVLLVGSALRFIAVDVEFGRQLRTKGEVHWGELPPRFAAAELIQLEINPAQLAVLEKATARVRYKRVDEVVELTLAQFIVGATIRLLKSRADFVQLKGDLAPFLGEKLPRFESLERAAAARPAAKETQRKPTPSVVSNSPTVIVSSSMLGLPAVAAETGALPAGVWKGVDVPRRPERASRRTEPLPPSKDDSLDRDERVELAAWAPIPSPLAKEARRWGQGGGGEEADPGPETDGAGAPPLEARSLRFDLRVGLGIGGLLLASAVASGAWVMHQGAKAGKAPAIPEAAQAQPSEPTEQLDELAPLPRSPDRSSEVPPAEQPSQARAPVERPTLPPPPDLPDLSSDPERVAARQALQALAKEFRTKVAPAQDVDALLRKVYGRPRVGADGKIGQTDMDPERRYDPIIRRAVAAVAHVYPVPMALVKAVIKRESNFDPEAHSVAGAIGLMQLMPYNAVKVNVSPDDLTDPESNIIAGTRLLAVLLRYYEGDVINTLVAYNSRARTMFAPVPRNGETPGYVAAVLGFIPRYEEKAAAPAGP